MSATNNPSIRAVRLRSWTIVLFALHASSALALRNGTPVVPIDPSVVILNIYNPVTRGSRADCRATVIDDEIIVTAAHCVSPRYGKPADPTVYRVGIANQGYFVRSWMIHPDYSPIPNKGKYFSDIAVGVLDRKVPAGTMPYAWVVDTRPGLKNEVLTPHAFENHEDGYLIHGRQQRGSARIDRIDTDSFEGIRIARLSMRPASSNRDLKWCFGDSGSPLYRMASDGTRYLVGVMSIMQTFGIYRDQAKKCDTYQLASYTAISSHQAWLSSAIGWLKATSTLATAPGGSSVDQAAELRSKKYGDGKKKKLDRMDCPAGSYAIGLSVQKNHWVFSSSLSWVSLTCVDGSGSATQVQAGKFISKREIDSQTCGAGQMMTGLTAIVGNYMKNVKIECAALSQIEPAVLSSPRWQSRMMLERRASGGDRIQSLSCYTPSMQAVSGLRLGYRYDGDEAAITAFGLSCKPL